MFCVEDLKTQVGDRKPPRRWSAFPENLLRKGGGRGEAGAYKLLQYPLQIEESTIKLQTQCRWFNWMNTQELKRSCAGKNEKRQKKKPHNFLTAFGTYQWRKMSAPSTSSLGPWIFLWSCLATPITGLNLQYSLIVFLFSTTLCLEPLPS